MAFEETPIRHAADRRRFLRQTSSALGGSLALALLPGDNLMAAPRAGADAFTLGIASGDPAADGAVLWTRLAPDPLNGGGMPPVPVPVSWTVASDAAMTRIVRRGVAIAHPDLAHSVHVEVTGLLPGREYFYRFSQRGEESAVGRFKTAAAPGTGLDALRFAFVTCQAWESGYYTAYADLARQDLDLVLHLGDYIYEYGIGANARGRTLPSIYAEQTRTLEQYRARHALYKTDPDLQAAHALCAWAPIWDDHELENDYVGQDPYYLTPAYLAQRAAAYQAFYEHLPLRNAARPEGPDMLLHRRLRFGDLLELSMLDTRQYRTGPPCGYGEQLPCPERQDPSQTMLGQQQEQWLRQGLARSTASWNIIGQQVLMAELLHVDSGPRRYWTDSWDGFPRARRRLLQHIADQGVANPVILTGDWHSTFVNDLKLDFKRPGAPVVATEFVTPAITTGGDDTPYGPYYGPFVPFNPHIKYFEGDRRGYFRATLTPERLTCDLRFVSAVGTPTATATTERSWVVESGAPGALVA